jgi:hypothetical protein
MQQDTYVAAVPPATVPADTTVVATDPDPDRQQLKWGPIWAGVVAAFGIFVLLSMLAIALGLQAAPGVSGQNLGIGASIVTSIITLVAFFIGGFISAWSANLSDPSRALLNGFLVWSLFVAVVALLAALGVGSVLGAASNLFDQLRLPTDVNVNQAQAIQALKDASWQSLLALGLTAAAAALGGVVGARDEVRRWGAVVVSR